MRGYWGLVIGPSLLGPQVLVLVKTLGAGALVIGPSGFVLVKTLGAGQPHTSRSRIRPAAYMFYWGSTHWGIHVLRRGPIGGDLNVEGRIAPRGGIRWSIQTVQFKAKSNYGIRNT